MQYATYNNMQISHTILYTSHHLQFAPANHKGSLGELWA